MVENLIRSSMNNMVFGCYFFFGNSVSLATAAMAGMGIGRINHNIHMVRHLYHMINEFLESMERLMNFYTAPEAQHNMIERKSECAEDDYAVKLNGYFTYGVTPCKDYDEKK